MTEVRKKMLAILKSGNGPDVAEAADRGDKIFARHGSGWSTDDAVLDSLDKLEFVMAVEDAFNIDIPEPLIVDVRTFDGMVDLVDTLMKPPANGSH